MGALDDAGDIGAGVEQVTADTADRPGKHQDDVGGHHGFYALANAVHKLAEAQHLAAENHEIQEGENQGQEAAHGQGQGCVGIAKGIGNGHAAAKSEAAHMEHSCHAEDNQGHNGDN